MISSEAFVLSLGLLLGSLVAWACKRLPDERWQFLASVPIVKDSSGRWHGLNFTYYGLLTANALVFGVALLIVLLGALHVATTVNLGARFRRPAAVCAGGQMGRKARGRESLHVYGGGRLLRWDFRNPRSSFFF
jgi:hypothetical protein